MGIRLSSLAGLARLDPVLDEAAHVRPVEVALDDLERLCIAVMTGVSRVMGLLQDPDAQGLEVGYVDSVPRV